MIGFILAMWQNKTVILGCLMGATIAGLMTYTWYINGKIEVLEANEAARVAAIEQVKETARQLEDLQHERNEAIARVGALEKKLRTHDLGKLARAKPRMVERRATAATNRTLRMFECVTGSPNSDCPEANTD